MICDQLISICCFNSVHELFRFAFRCNRTTNILLPPLPSLTPTPTPLTPIIKRGAVLQREERSFLWEGCAKAATVEEKKRGVGEANAVSLASSTDSRRCGFGSGRRRRSGPSCARTKAVSFAPSTIFDYRFPPLASCASSSFLSCILASHSR